MPKVSDKKRYFFACPLEPSPKFVSGSPITRSLKKVRCWIRAFGNIKTQPDVFLVFQDLPANTNALNEMLKRVQHDKKKCVIPNLFRNLEFGNDKELIAFALVSSLSN